jgi:hypothetical protein
LAINNICHKSLHSFLLLILFSTHTVLIWHLYSTDSTQIIFNKRMPSKQEDDYQSIIISITNAFLVTGFIESRSIESRALIFYERSREMMFQLGCLAVYPYASISKNHLCMCLRTRTSHAVFRKRHDRSCNKEAR